jgi:hypothetical protein
LPCTLRVGSVTVAQSRLPGPTLYLDALQSGVPPAGQLSGDEVAALPYSYIVG